MTSEGVVRLVTGLSAPAVPRDRAGYAAVYSQHRDGVLRLAYLLAGDHHLAEEATAEAFARVWPHWRAGRVDDERTYLRKAVVNEVRSRWRRRALERREEERRRRGFDGAPAAERGAEHDRVVRALRALPPDQRAVVVLRFFEDLSEAETAAALGLRPGTVKSRTARALDRLRPLLEEDDR